MTSLDASVLTSDAQGLGLLKAVLDLPERSAPPVGAFDPNTVRLSWTICPDEAQARLADPRRVTESV